MTCPADGLEGQDAPHQGEVGRQSGGRDVGVGRLQRRQALHLVPQHVVALSGVGNTRRARGTQAPLLWSEAISRPHCRGSSWCLRARLGSACTLGRELVPTHGAPAGTLISLLPLPLLGVDVLL